MTDLSQMREEDITRWREDDDPESLVGEPVGDDFEGEDSDAQPV